MRRFLWLLALSGLMAVFFGLTVAYALRGEIAQAGASLLIVCVAGFVIWSEAL